MRDKIYSSIGWGIVGCLALWAGSCSNSRAADVRPVIVYSHTSDLFRGPPINNRREWAVNFLGAGITIRQGRYEIDLTHGIKNYNSGRNEPGTNLTVRFYPGRKR